MASQQTTIGKKIGSGFAAVLLLVVMLTGIYQFALSSATAKFTSLIEQDMAIAYGLLFVLHEMECLTFGDEQTTLA